MMYPNLAITAAVAAFLGRGTCWQLPTPRVHASRASAISGPVPSSSLSCQAPLRCARVKLAATTESEAPADDDERPYPKIGDVVTYPGKWKDEVAVGEVVNLQYIGSRGKWIADVKPLEEIGEGQYARPRGRDRTVEDVENLKPVRAFFVRSTNAYKVMTKEGSDSPTLISDAYRTENFELLKPKMDAVRLAESLAEYEALKTRILRDTLVFGAVGTAVATAAGGVKDGAVFALGALFSAAYLYLLERNADAIGKRAAIEAFGGGGGGSTWSVEGSEGDNNNNNNNNNGDNTAALDLLRISLPLILVGGLAAVNYVTDPSSAKLLQLVPRDQFAAAMLGFVASYRVPLVVREVAGAIQPEDLLSTLPGSVGKGAELWRNARSSSSNAGDAPLGVVKGAESPVIVVSGPRGIRRSTLVDELLAEEPKLRRPLLWTSRPAKAGETDGEKYRFVEPAKMEELTRARAFIHLYADGEDGAEYGLRAEELLLPPKEEGKVCVIDADAALVAKLMAVEGAALVGVWVSLDSLVAIEARLKATIESDPAFGGDESAIAAEVRARVKQVIDDIEFGVTSAVFEFTALSGEGEASLAKLRKAAGYALAALPSRTT